MTSAGNLRPSGKVVLKETGKTGLKIKKRSYRSPKSGKTRLKSKELQPSKNAAGKEKKPKTVKTFKDKSSIEGDPIHLLSRGSKEETTRSSNSQRSEETFKEVL